jgi:hypothetical protein
MAAIVGEKLAFLNAVDSTASDTLASTYTIDVILTRGPKTGTKAAGIVVFKINDMDMDLLSLDDAVLKRRMDRLKEEADKWTEVQVEGPILFRQEPTESQGRWLERTEAELFRLFDKYQGHADVKVKAPLLRIVQVIPRADVRKSRHGGKMTNAFRNIDKLLDAGFAYDPWLRGMRRGKISAAMAKQVKG